MKIIGSTLVQNWSSCGATEMAHNNIIKLLQTKPPYKIIPWKQHWLWWCSYVSGLGLPWIYLASSRSIVSHLGHPHQDHVGHKITHMASNMEPRMLLELGSSVPMQNHKSITQLRRFDWKIIDHTFGSCQKF